MCLGSLSLELYIFLQYFFNVSLFGSESTALLLKRYFTSGNVGGRITTTAVFHVPSLLCIDFL